MDKKFKKYVHENDFCNPPSLDSEDSILKSWLEQKMSRKSLSMGVFKDEKDDDYTDYEIKKIKELFTEDEINKLCPQDWKSEFKKNAKIYIPSIIGLGLILKVTIKTIGLFYLGLIIFLVVWNIFLKSYLLGALVKLFGDNIMVKNRSSRECYELYTMGRNAIQSVVVDSFLLPIIIYVLFSIFLKVLF
tara:strand:- start:263 stop:829 length:567 start_codon:yes stop_codon:yes gene_type:complete